VRRSCRVLAAAPLLLAWSGCRAACRLEPATVIDKDERVSIEEQLRGVQADARGRVVEDRQLVLLRRHWIKAEDGRWYPVTAETWSAATRGGSVQVCR
jgi:hypothetical protein